MHALARLADTGDGNLDTVTFAGLGAPLQERGATMKIAMSVPGAQALRSPSHTHTHTIAQQQRSSKGLSHLLRRKRCLRHSFLQGRLAQQLWKQAHHRRQACAITNGAGEKQ